MNRPVLISLGSNLGDRFQFLQQAQTLLSRCLGSPFAVSTIRETPAFGVENHPPYLNQVLGFETALPARQIFEYCIQVEDQLGRDGKGQLLPRTIDIDLLACGDEIFRHPDLQIPHPSLHLRKFVLEPLEEIMPGWEHPLLGLSAHYLLRKLSSGSDKTGLHSLIG